MGIDTTISPLKILLHFLHGDAMTYAICRGVVATTSTILLCLEKIGWQENNFPEIVFPQQRTSPWCYREKFLGHGHDAAGSLLHNEALNAVNLLE